MSQSFISIVSSVKASHNKDYSVVKTSKAGQLAFFVANSQLPPIVCPATKL